MSSVFHQCSCNESSIKQQQNINVSEIGTKEQKDQFWFYWYFYWSINKTSMSTQRIFTEASKENQRVRD